MRRDVHRADRVPRHQEGRPRGQAVRAIRPVEIPHAVPRRRARRSRHHRMGRAAAEEAGDRSLVADRDRLGDRRQSGGPRHAAGQARLADRGDAGLRRARRRRAAARRCRRGKMGSIVVKLPLPPSCLPTLWQQDERFAESYLAEFPGYYKTADAGFKDEDGYVFVMGRTDDIINVAGHRLSTGGMEEVLAGAPGRRRMRRASASRTSSRARCRAASSCSRPASTAPPARSRRRCVAAGARQDRPGGGVQARHHRARACRRRARARSCAAP